MRTHWIRQIAVGEGEMRKFNDQVWVKFTNPDSNTMRFYEGRICAMQGVKFDGSMEYFVEVNNEGGPKDRRNWFREKSVHSSLEDLIASVPVVRY